ncbi:hypothetical protein UPYG_G00043420 [Umbra pygmaea]|uniref:Uncharacterized protein n=1 Tax=Umbra pygmaea TaxID=75934 RepID=A0ABD0XQL9_UMBPY
MQPRKGLETLVTLRSFPELTVCLRNKGCSRLKKHIVYSILFSARMAVSVRRDLSVNVSADINTDKLADKQQALLESIRKGEPKAFGVSQVMLGVLVLSFSFPLLYTEFTQVIIFGVPWWSSLSFIAAGVIAIVLEKHTSLKLLSVCLVMTVVAISVSILALIFYFIDLHKNPETPCNTPEEGSHYDFYPCDNQHYSTMISYGVKSSLLFFTLVQATISSSLFYFLFKERRGYGQYTSLDQKVPETPTTLTYPDFE